MTIYSLTQITSVSTSRSSGYDGLSSYAVKQAGNALATPLFILINKSFVTGHFPDSLKLGKVVPIFKTGSKHEISNYRPIIILSIFSEVFEKIVQNRLMHFIDQHGLLSDSQFGFRPNRSTDLAIISVLK